MTRITSFVALFLFALSVPVGADDSTDSGDFTPASLEGRTIETIDEENVSIEFRFFGNDQFAFTKGSQGHLKMVVRRRTRPGGSHSDRSSGKYSSQPGSYKYQCVVPLIWETINPSLCNAVPVITTSEVLGQPALDVVPKHDIYGLPIKRSLPQLMQQKST